MENRKKLLSVKDLVVKFRVRGRVLTAIRGISLDIYENESIAIVGESGSGKSVFTKTFANMLDGNGFIDQGKIIFNDPALADTIVRLGEAERKQIRSIANTLSGYSKLESGASTYRQMKNLESEKRQREILSDEESEAFEKQLNDLQFRRAEAFNLKQTFDPRKEKDKIKASAKEIEELDAQIKAVQKQKQDTIKSHKTAARQDSAYMDSFKQRMDALKQAYAQECARPVSEDTIRRSLPAFKSLAAEYLK